MFTAVCHGEVIRAKNAWMISIEKQIVYLFTLGIYLWTCMCLATVNVTSGFLLWTLNAKKKFFDVKGSSSFILLIYPCNGDWENVSAGLFLCSQWLFGLHHHVHFDFNLIKIDLNTPVILPLNSFRWKELFRFIYALWRFFAE